MAAGSNNERLFPTLSETQMNRIAAHGGRRQTTKGEVLTEVGDIAPFFVVVRGTLEVLSPAAGVEKIIVTHGTGEFTGEAKMARSFSSINRLSSRSSRPTPS